MFEDGGATDRQVGQPAVLHIGGVVEIGDLALVVIIALIVEGHYL
jgi:hypothetical protein